MADIYLSLPVTTASSAHQRLACVSDYKTVVTWFWCAARRVEHDRLIRTHDIHPILLHQTSPYNSTYFLNLCIGTQAHRLRGLLCPR